MFLLVGSFLKTWCQIWRPWNHDLYEVQDKQDSDMYSGEGILVLSSDTEVGDASVNRGAATLTGNQ